MIVPLFRIEPPATDRRPTALVARPLRDEHDRAVIDDCAAVEPRVVPL